MSHPYKAQADDTHRTKRGVMGKDNNLDIPVMKAVGENSIAKKIHQSSASMQHREQSAHNGMKKGGHVGKGRHHKPKVVAMVAPAGDTGNPPLPDPALAAAGAGPSPAPAPTMPPPGAGTPPPGMPPAKRGGRMKRAEGGSIDDDGYEKPDSSEEGIKKANEASNAFANAKFKRGGRFKDGGKVMNPWMSAGRGSGEGNLQTAHATKRKSGLKPIKAGD